PSRQPEPARRPRSLPRGQRREARGRGDVAVRPGEQIPLVEGARTLGARRGPRGLAMPVGDVPGRAYADPRSELGRRLAVVGGAAHVAEVAGDRLPARAVAGAGARERVGDFVEEGLVVGVVVVTSGEVPRHTDALVRVIAQSGAALGVVESERPRRVEMG